MDNRLRIMSTITMIAAEIPTGDIREIHGIRMVAIGINRGRVVMVTDTNTVAKMMTMMTGMMITVVTTGTSFAVMDEAGDRAAQ